jgi:flagellar hook-basal body complex protein FliE
MSDMEISQMVREMQRLAVQARGMSESAGVETGGFAELLQTSIARVNEAQHSASDFAQAFEQGDKDVALPEVMIALQKAQLSFQAMTEVRNRLVSAYQEIMSMPV